MCIMRIQVVHHVHNLLVWASARDAVQVCSVQIRHDVVRLVRSPRFGKCAGLE